VPAGERWYVAGDGTAVPLGRAHPDDDCRVTHWLLCPAAEPQARLDGPLYGVWARRRAQLGPS
jgi:hypothetical protein